MSYLPRWNPYRCMRGWGAPTSASSQAITELYNNSNGADLLLLWNLNDGKGATSPGIVAGFETGHTAATAGKQGPLMADQAPQAGLIYTATTASALASDYYVADGSTTPVLLGIGVPLAVIPPGYSFFVQWNGSSTGDLAMGFVWQAIHADDLMGKHCPVCDGAHAP